MWVEASIASACVEEFLVVVELLQQTHAVLQTGAADCGGGGCGGGGAAGSDSGGGGGCSRSGGGR